MTLCATIPLGTRTEFLKTGIALQVVENQNPLSTTNLKPPKNLFDKFSNMATNN